jgi:hypothetical protein
MLTTHSCCSSLATHTTHLVSYLIHEGASQLAPCTNGTSCTGLAGQGMRMTVPWRQHFLGISGRVAEPSWPHPRRVASNPRQPVGCPVLDPPFKLPCIGLHQLAGPDPSTGPGHHSTHGPASLLNSYMCPHAVVLHNNSGHSRDVWTARPTVTAWLVSRLPTTTTTRRQQQVERHRPGRCKEKTGGAAQLC